MTIEIFEKKYKAVSNLFTRDIESNDYVFPAPLSIYGTIENETKNTKNILEFKFNSYYDSILIIDNYFQLFFYLLDFEYKLGTVLVENIIKTESNTDMYGYKGKYSFMEGNILLNIGTEEIYDDYCKIKTKL